MASDPSPLRALAVASNSSSLCAAAQPACTLPVSVETHPLKSSLFPEFTLPLEHLEEQYTYIARSSTFARLETRKPLERPLPTHLYDWLGPQAAAWRSDKPLALLEVYCGARSNLTKVAQRSCEGRVLRIGLDHGQDFLKPKHRKNLYELAEWARAEHTHVAWPYKGLGGFNRINMAKTYSTASATAIEARQESTIHRRWVPEREWIA